MGKNRDKYNRLSHSSSIFKSYLMLKAKIMTTSDVVLNVYRRNINTFYP